MTFGKNGPKLHSRPVYCSRLYGNPTFSLSLTLHGSLMFPYFLTNLLIITSKSCPRGQRVTPDGKSCVDRNECLDNPCRNNGQCINRDTVERYTCLCPTGFSGNNCELMQEEQILRLSMGALAIILLCLLSILSKDNSIIKNKLTA